MTDPRPERLSSIAVRRGCALAATASAVLHLAMIAVHWSLPDCHAASVAVNPHVDTTALISAATILAALEAVLAAAVVMTHFTRRRAQALYGLLRGRNHGR
jgi:hypothetical protein